MIYKDFMGKKVSTLGLGCMRLPHFERYEDINIDAVKEMVSYAIKNGVNYFDTAWMYHNGKSEPVMGEVLSEYDRESFFLASKFPGHEASCVDKVEEVFEEQLRRCKVDYFDFYLFHNVCEADIEQYLDPKYRIFDYLIEQKKNGRIKHLGFSVHASQKTFERFLDAYGDFMEFAQIQLNWLDFDFQNAKAKIEVLNRRNIPIWVMEPLRGGKLCNLADCYREKLEKLKPDRNMVEWAFRFLQSVEGVTVTLSGMSNFEQLKENIEIFSEYKPTNQQEREVLFDIAKDMTSKNTLACTSCRYCTEHCPMELDIPKIIELYNENMYSGGGINALMENKNPTACIGCRACEDICPQKIKISEMMSDFGEKFK